MDTPNNPTRERILDIAEQLFSERGYKSVRLRDIADVVGMRHASLYYYAPKGKEQLFVEVMARSFNRHRDGMEQAIQEAGPGIRPKMQAVARWLLAQPPLDMGRMVHSDMPAISAENAQRLSWIAFDSLRQPLARALEAAAAQGELHTPDPSLAALSFVTLIESIHMDESMLNYVPKHKIADQIIDMLLHGWLKR